MTTATVDRHAVQRLLAEGALLLDVLPEEEYAREHLPGALNLPLKHFSAKRLGELPRGRPVVVYCADNQ